jgi:hypothetical protein
MLQWCKCCIINYRFYGISILFYFLSNRWDSLVEKAKLTSYTQQYFYLFEIVEYNFERKLQSTEIPHQLYVQNYSTASSTCLSVRRWLFSISRELSLPAGEQAAKFIFYQVRGNFFLNKLALK